METRILDSDLPRLYQTSNSNSIKQQRNYYRGILFHMILLTIGLLFLVFPNRVPNSPTKITSVIFMLSSLGVIIWLRIFKPHNLWYTERAIAESVKTITWKWMLKTEPYQNSKDLKTTKEKFIKDLKTILAKNKKPINKLETLAIIDESISNKMIHIRSLSIIDRISVYKKERIENQVAWYSQKATLNKKKSRQWFIITSLIHAIAIICIFYNLKESSLKMLIEFIVIITSGILTWLQVKKHDELLSSSYSLTAHEIILTKVKTTPVRTESELSKYIMNCETIFYQEHNQWIERKNK